MAELREHVPAGGAAMWWSHTDAAEYRAWLTRTGPVVGREEFVPEGDGGHALFRARGPRRAPDERPTSTDERGGPEPAG
ncbi:hypothetical protein [Streptomyces macrosporus]|uniref:Uncharacterized protein n=1 Tax=Streptomyces macrosporus TaxID=44032 RepID=A0ABP5WV04_9ACTN